MGACRLTSLTVQEALAEIEKLDNRLIDLDKDLHHATSNGSEAVPRMEWEIYEAMARKEWLLSRCAELVIAHYGTDADAIAEQRAADLRALGASNAAERWMQIKTEIGRIAASA